MARSYSATITTLEKEIFVGEVISINIPGREGYMDVLLDHTAIITSLKEGVVRFTSHDGTKHTYRITGGVFEMYQNHATLLIDLLCTL